MTSRLFNSPLENSNPMLFPLTLLAPDKYKSQIPDDVLNRSVVKSDIWNYMMTSLGGEGSFTIEFYPESSNDVLGAIFKYVPALLKESFQKNICRSVDYKEDFNYLRSVAKKLTLILNTRTNLQDDTIAGRLAGIVSQVGISEIGYGLTYSNILGAVNNIELKKNTNINDGLVCLSLPSGFEQPFQRLKDKASFVTNAANIGTQLVEPIATLNDSDTGYLLRFSCSDSALNTVINTFEIFCDRYIDVDFLPKVVCTINTRISSANNTAATVKASYNISTFDLVGDLIQTVTVNYSNNVAFVANIPVDNTSTQFLSQVTDPNDATNRPVHRLRVQGYLWTSAITTFNVNTTVILTSNAGKDDCNLKPVVVIKGQGIPQDAVVDINLATVDELVPNGNLQRNTELLHPLYSPLSLKIAKLLLAHPIESGVRPLMDFEEYDRLIQRFESTILTKEEERIIMEASSSDWLKKIGKALKTGASVYQSIRPVIEATPLRAALPAADMASGVIMSSASKPFHQNRLYYAASDQETDENFKKLNDPEEETRYYERQPGDSMVPFPAIWKNPKEGEQHIGCFVALAGGDNVLLSKDQRSMYATNPRKKKIYGMMSPNRKVVDMKSDIRILAVPWGGVTEKGITYYGDPPLIAQDSCLAAVELASCNKDLWNPNFLVSASVRKMNGETMLHPVLHIREKAEETAKHGLKLITTRSSEKGTINRNYLRQVLSLLRERKEKGSSYPDEPSRDPLSQTLLLAFSSSSSYVPKNRLIKGLIRESELEEISKMRKEGRYNQRVYLCMEEETRPKPFTQTRTYGEPVLVEPEDDQAAQWQRNEDTLNMNVATAFRSLMDENVVGPDKAAYYEKLQNLMGLMQNILDKAEQEGNLEDTDKTVGVALTYYNQNSQFAASVRTSLGRRSVRDRYEWIRAAAQYPVSPWDKLPDKTKKLITNYPALLNYDLSGIFDVEKIRNEEVVNMRTGQDLTENCLYMGNLEKVARLALANGIEPYPENFAELAELLQISPENPPNNTITGDQNRALSAIASGKSSFAAKVVTLYDKSNEERRKELIKRDINPTQQNLEKAIQAEQEGNKSWEQLFPKEQRYSYVQFNTAQAKLPQPKAVPKTRQELTRMSKDAPNPTLIKKLKDAQNLELRRAKNT